MVKIFQIVPGKRQQLDYLTKANIAAADDLAKWARASAAMVLTQFLCNIPLPTHLDETKTSTW